MLTVPLRSSALRVSEGGYTLSKNIPAIQIVSGYFDAKSRLGLMTQLPGGAELEMGGPGFDENTVRVRCAGTDYYVFLDDLEPQRKRAAATSGNSR